MYYRTVALTLVAVGLVLASIWVGYGLLVEKDRSTFLDFDAVVPEGTFSSVGLALKGGQTVSVAASVRLLNSSSSSDILLRVLGPSNEIVLESLILRNGTGGLRSFQVAFPGSYTFVLDNSSSSVSMDDKRVVWSTVITDPDPYPGGRLRFFGLSGTIVSAAVLAFVVSIRRPYSTSPEVSS